MNFDELREFYEDLKINGATTYWLNEMIEYILKQHTSEEINNMNLSLEEIKAMTYDLMQDKKIWEIIDKKKEEKVKEYLERKKTKEKVLHLELEYDNPGYARKHYKGYYGKNKYNIVIFDGEYKEITTASKDGEPNAPLKAGIHVVLENVLYITVKKGDISILEEVKNYENNF